MDPAPPIPHALLDTILAPSLSSLAADLSTTPADLADLLSSPELTDILAALITNLEALEHLRALAARAPATATCRALLATDNPIEQRRVAATLLRTPIHAHRSHQPTPRASQRRESAPPAHPHSSHTPHHAAHEAPQAHAPDHADNATRDLESLLSLLLTPTPANPDLSPRPIAAPTTDRRDSESQSERPRPPQHLSGPDLPPCRTAAPARPGTHTPPPEFPPAPTLHRRTPPTHAASLRATAGSPPHPRPP